MKNKRNMRRGVQLSHHLISLSSLVTKVSTTLSKTLAASVLGCAVRIDSPDSASSLILGSSGRRPKNCVFDISAKDSPPPVENMFVHSWKTERKLVGLFNFYSQPCNSKWNAIFFCLV